MNIDLNKVELDIIEECLKVKKKKIEAAQQILSDYNLEGDLADERDDIIDLIIKIEKSRQ